MNDSNTQTPVGKAATAKPTPLQAHAQAYIDAGYKVVAIRSHDWDKKTKTRTLGSKAPATIDGHWAPPLADATGLKPGQGVGVAHHLNRTVCVDPDHPLAQKVMDALSLGECDARVPQWSSGAKPDCAPKRLYRIPAGVKFPGVQQLKAVIGGKTVTIVELRGSTDDSQCQDILPGSVHKDTRTEYVWHEGTTGLPHIDDLPDAPPRLLTWMRNWDALEPALLKHIGSEGPIQRPQPTNATSLTDSGGDAFESGAVPGAPVGADDLSGGQFGGTGGSPGGVTFSTDPKKGERTPSGSLVAIAEIMSALGATSPEDYDVWVRVGQALWHEASGGAEALAVWVAWSRGSSKFHPGECEKKWPSFSAPSSGRATTLATLFWMARRGGWEKLGDPRNEVEERLIREQEARQIIEFGATRVYLLDNGQEFYVFRSNAPGVEETRTRYTTLRALAERYRKLLVPTIEKTKLKWVRLVPRWNASVHRREFDEVEFRPIPRMLATDRVPDGKHLNLFCGMKVAPVPGDCGLILDHIKTIWCDGVANDYEYILNWMARLFQFPAERGETLLVLQGLDGSGKSIITDLLANIWGQHGMTTPTKRNVAGRFNATLGHVVLAVMDESLITGRTGEASTLRSLITSKTLVTEEKFRPAVIVKNCLHMVITTNLGWAAPISLRDRRYACFSMVDVERTDEERRAYFIPLGDQIKAGGDAAFLDLLLKRDISGFDPASLPVGNIAMRAQQKFLSADSITRWWVQVLDDNDDTLSLLRPPNKHATMLKIAVFASYADFHKTHRVQKPGSNNEVARFVLGQTVWAQPTRPTAGGRRVQAYRFPTLAQARARYERENGAVGWPAIDYAGAPEDAFGDAAVGVADVDVADLGG